MFEILTLENSGQQFTCLSIFKRARHLLEEEVYQMGHFHKEHSKWEPRKRLFFQILHRKEKKDKLHFEKDVIQIFNRIDGYKILSPDEKICNK